MLKNILKLEGIKQLNKSEQSTINGGSCSDVYQSCTNAFNTPAEITTCMHIWLCGDYKPKKPQIIIND